jgi:hypothetical protein
LLESLVEFVDLDIGDPGRPPRRKACVNPHGCMLPKQRSEAVGAAGA